MMNACGLMNLNRSTVPSSSTDEPYSNIEKEWCARAESVVTTNAPPSPHSAGRQPADL
jgi:hypothetical protein